MGLFLAGVGVFLLTGLVFWYCLPRGGKPHRFVGTEVEPYVGVAFCSAVALSFTMMLSGAINWAGGQ
jgi:hypothetical protein